MVVFAISKKERISMDILKRASAGTLESSDAYIEIEPGEGGLSIQLESVVLGQFGDSIDRTVREVLAEQDVTNANVRVIDRGALECVLRARVETAVLRGKGEV
jgi:citrate lyase subunit gamma (acyl carrier protein)